MKSRATPEEIARAYQLLGVSPEQPLDDIKKQYWHKSLAVHPHNHPDDPQAAAKMRSLSEAMDVIRGNHGNFLRPQPVPTPPAGASPCDVFVAYGVFVFTIWIAPSLFFAALGRSVGRLS